MTADELAALRSRLHDFMTPAAMRDLVEEASIVAGRRALYQAGLSVLWRDAFIAAEVARLADASLVRLIADERPDFAILIGGDELLYEATQADQPGRQIGREFRELDEAFPNGDSAPKDDPYESVAARAANAAAMLEAAAQRKATGDYDPSWGLVIYLNLAEYGWFTEQVEAVMEAATAPARGRFREVLVLWKERLYRVDEGRRAD